MGTLKKHNLGALLRCDYIFNRLATSLYTAYYLGICVPCASHCIPNNAFLEATQ